MTDHQDSYLDMCARRVINEDYAEQPVNFNVEGLRLANQYAPLTGKDNILDIGCSSGKFVLEAAKETGTIAHIYGLEPDASLQDYLFLAELAQEVDASRFTFLQGYGEDIPLPDNAVKVATAHNVIFRSSNVTQMLAEMKRVTEPEGLLVISTNAADHAKHRHRFERAVANVVQFVLGEPVRVPTIPAQTCYLENLPDMLASAGGLEVVDDTVIQECKTVITRDRVLSYMHPIHFSANRTNIPPNKRYVWRQAVRSVVEPYIMNEIEEMERAHNGNSAGIEPHFADIVHRGMVIARNLKSTNH